MDHSHEGLAKYKDYLKLTPKERRKRIDKAEQSEAYLKKNPQGKHVFPEIGFIDFEVEESKGNYIRLATYRYACQQPKAIVVMFHGLNSYMGHGAHLAHDLAVHHILTVGFDHRGFGRSEGKSGYVQSLELHVQDSLQFVIMMRQIYKNIPMFCLGLSMGGMCSYYLTLKYPELFQGAVLMAPALKNSIGGFLVGVSNALKKILPEHTELTKPIYGKASKNPKITEDVKNDPYTFKERMPLSTVNFIVSTMDLSPDTFSEYNVPFLIIQGGLDKLVNPDVAFELYEKSKTKPQDKEILFYQNMWHDIWHEDQIAEIIEKITIWLLKRIEKSKKE